MTSLPHMAREHTDRIALAVLAFSFVFMPGMRAGVVGLGFVAGAVLALHATGLVLVYRSNRIVNFAQVQTAVLAGTAFRLLVEQRGTLRVIDAICPPCIGEAGRAHLWLDYLVAVVVSVGLAVLVSWAVYAVVVRRLAATSALVVTVATIGVAQLLASVQASLPGMLATEAQRDESALPRGVAAPPPVELSFDFGGVVFGAAAVFTIAVASLTAVGLVAFFRRSDVGVAIRASADNPQRAVTVGVPVTAVTGRVWALAGLLAGMAGVLEGMASAATEPGFGVPVLVRVLAVAVFARMVSLGVAALAGVAVGVFDQSMLWTAGSATVTDGVLLGVIAVVLGLQRARLGRVDAETAGLWEGAREIAAVPKALRDLAGVRAWMRGVKAVAVVAVLVVPWVLSAAQVNVATITIVYAMIGVSLLVLTGWAGQISLGHFAFAAIGGYATAVFAGRWGIPLPVALVGGGLAGAAVAVAVGVPSLRLRGLELAVTTLAVALSTTAILLNPTYLGAALPESFDRPGFLDSERVFYYVALVLLVAVVAAVVGMRRSRMARALIACRDNEAAAQTFGINIVRTRLVAFAASGFIAAFAGAIFAVHQRGVPAAAYAPEVSVLMFLMVVIGGLGSVAGPIVGALYIGLLTFFVDSALVTFLATGGGVVLLLLVAPGGLVQVAARVRDALVRGAARRHGADAGLDARGGLSPEERPALAPKVAGGRAAYVPERYTLPDPWVKAGEGGD